MSSHFSVTSRAAAGFAALCVASAFVVGCGAPGVAPPPAAGPPVPVADLPDCDAPRSPDPPLVLPGALLPDDAYLTATDVDGPIALANGWVPRLPVDLLGFYEDPPAGWTTLTSEHEVVEAEVLLDSGAHRLFVLASATCRGGSTLYLRIMASPD